MFGEVSWADLLWGKKLWSWGSGDSYVLGNRSEESVEVPTLITKPIFDGTFDLMGAGSQHAVFVSLKRKPVQSEEPELAKKPKIV